VYYQILGRNSTKLAESYRGVARYGPSYDESQPEDSIYNLAWRELVERGERLESHEDALRLANQLDASGAELDVIGVELVDADAPLKHPLMGYDVASKGRESILSWGARWEADRKALFPLGPILALIEAHFRPNLNEFGLLSTPPTAEMLRSALLALQALVPNALEAPGHYHPETLAIFGVRLARFSP
jgi:hypothetical protein